MLKPVGRHYGEKWVADHHLKTLQKKQDDTWLWKRVLSIRDEMLLKFGSELHCRGKLRGWSIGGKFSVWEAYEEFRERAPKCQWHKLIWDSANMPRHTVISLMAIHKKLATVENLARRGIVPAILLFV